MTWPPRSSWQPQQPEQQHRLAKPQSGTSRQHQSLSVRGEATADAIGMSRKSTRWMRLFMCTRPLPDRCGCRRWWCQVTGSASQSAAAAAVPAGERRCPDVDSILSRRLRRRPSIESTSGQRRGYACWCCLALQGLWRRYRQTPRNFLQNFCHNFLDKDSTSRNLPQWWGWREGCSRLFFWAASWHSLLLLLLDSLLARTRLDSCRTRALTFEVTGATDKTGGCPSFRDLAL